jgi:hypothetical protein
MRKLGNRTTKDNLQVWELADTDREETDSLRTRKSRDATGGDVELSARQRAEEIID